MGRRSDRLTAIFPAIAACLCLSVASAAEPKPPPTTGEDAEIPVSRAALAKEMQRLREVEKLTDESPSWRVYQGELESIARRPESPDQIHIVAQFLAMMTGSRMGGPDPWRDIGVSDIAGRKVKAVGVYLNLPSLQDKAEEAEAAAASYAVVMRPEWREKILALYPARYGLLAVVAPEDVAPLEHALFGSYITAKSAYVRYLSGNFHEGMPADLHRKYIAPRTEEPPLSIEQILKDPKAHEDRRVTVAAYLVDYPIELPLALQSEPQDDRGDDSTPGSCLNLKNTEDGVYVFVTGQRGGRIDISMEEGAAERDLGESRERPPTKPAANGPRSWFLGRPVMATGVLRIGEFKDAYRTLHDHPWLEVETMRETTEDDPAWKAARAGR